MVDEPITGCIFNPLYKVPVCNIIHRKALMKATVSLLVLPRQSSFKIVNKSNEEN